MKNVNYHLIVDNIRSAQNIGAIFRTADAFGCEGIILTGISATPPNKEILKTALGATASVKWEYHSTTEEAIEYLKSNGYKIVAVEQSDKATLIQNYDFHKNEKQAFILGNEVEGISQQILNLCDEIIEIPQVGIKKSINVAVAAGIIMWSCHKINLSGA